MEKCPGCGSEAYAFQRWNCMSSSFNGVFHQSSPCLVIELKAKLAAETAKVVALVAVGEKHGWNGVENSKNLATFFDDHLTEGRENQLDSGNYRGRCDTCGTANSDMLTDTSCMSCELVKANAALKESERVNYQLRLIIETSESTEPDAYLDHDTREGK